MGASEEGETPKRKTHKAHAEEDWTMLDCEEVWAKCL